MAILANVYIEYIFTNRYSSACRPPPYIYHLHRLALLKVTNGGKPL